MVLRAKVKVEAEVRATEDEERVAKAIYNMTGLGSVASCRRGRQTFLVQEGDESLLVRLRQLLRAERILDAARKIMLRGVQGNSFSFYLNKQVAFGGHVSFCMPEGESPLGPLKFTVEVDDPKSFIDWLATKTVDGRPVDEICRSGSPPSARSERPLRK
ncbi:MAG: RNA-binding domain-containing protein [Candidatus Verstraetearchaeota archaeon]|nr:RNA-binding domain-containing protein [Candidatus Verstraetearchaeota archaeon]